MKNVISLILVLGMAASAFTVPSTNADNSMPKIHYEILGCEDDDYFVQNNIGGWGDTCQTIKNNVIAAQNHMYESTGFLPTANDKIEIFPDDNWLVLLTGGGAFIPRTMFTPEGGIMLSEKITTRPDIIAHEMTHAEICNRLNYCKNARFFPKKHSLSFEEGIAAQNNSGFYEKETMLEYQCSLLYEKNKDIQSCMEKNRDLFDKTYSEKNKKKLIFAPVGKGGPASYLVHKELVSKWIEKQGKNVISDMLNAVNSSNILPEEYFLQNGGEEIISEIYGAEGINIAKKNIRSLKRRYHSRIACILPLALAADRAIRSWVSLFKVAKLDVCGIKNKLININTNIKNAKHKKENVSEKNVPNNTEKMQTPGENCEINLEIQPETNAMQDDIVKTIEDEEHLNSEELKDNENNNDENATTDETQMTEENCEISLEIQPETNVIQNETVKTAEDNENVNLEEKKDDKNSITKNDTNDIALIDKTPTANNSFRQTLKQMWKYRLQAVLSIAATITLYYYCNQKF